MPNIMSNIISPRVYLIFCCVYFSVLAFLRLLSGYSLFRSFLGLGIFLILWIGIAYGVRLARKVMAVIHMTYVIFGLYTLSALIYHAGTTELLGQRVGTFPSVLLALLLNLYLLLGAIRLWRSA